MVEAVDQCDPASIFSQEAGQGKETKGSYPEIIGGEVGNPGVNQENMRGGLFHVKHLSNEGCTPNHVRFRVALHPYVVQGGLQT
jgi:hypothetical protein